VESDGYTLASGLSQHVLRSRQALLKARATHRSTKIHGDTLGLGGLDAFLMDARAKLTSR
jgi:hypothetical protein